MTNRTRPFRAPRWLPSVTLVLTALTVLLAPVSRADACPFCETGSTAAASFMLIFGALFALGMGCIVWVFARAGAFRKDSGVENQVLLVEGVEPKPPQQENRHDS